MHPKRLPDFMSTGELYLNDLDAAVKDVFTDFEYGPPEYVKTIHPTNYTGAELSFECDIDAALFDKVVGLDLSKNTDMTGFTVECKVPHKMQLRRHRKRRINKKWAKRYGYKVEFSDVRLKEVTFKDREDGLLDIEGYIEKGE